MHISLLLQLLILVVVANGAAVVAKKLLRGAFDRPLDGGGLFVDGQPILGPAKTIRGVVFSVLATSICSAIVGLGWKIGALIASFAIIGDLFSSFVKRRLRFATEPVVQVGAPLPRQPTEAISIAWQCLTVRRDGRLKFFCGLLILWVQFSLPSA